MYIIYKIKLQIDNIKIHNNIKMQSRIKAAIRIRPFLKSQINNGYKNTLFAIDQNKKQIYIKEQNNKKSFHFDYLFPQSSTQDDLYSGCKIDSMISKAIQGYHCTIFAYGQTGSGKTYTMQGTQQVQDGSKLQLNGLIPKIVDNLFNKIKNLQSKIFTVSVSFLQIYNQKIYDLLNPFTLNPKNVGQNLGGLRLRWNKHQQFTAQNLYISECKNYQQLLYYFLYGLKNRVNSSHKLNMNSSRSHSILTIKLESFDHDDPSHCIQSKIQLVDLAGSQRIGITGTQGKLAKQSIDINKSLFALRQVISLLSQKDKQKQKSYIPYRSSKLTSLLKQSIGGNSYCLMIACINPNDNFIQQNISTLTYATKVTCILNQPIINDDPRSKIINSLKQQVKNLIDQLNQANRHIQLISNFKQNNLSQNNNCYPNNNQNNYQNNYQNINYNQNNQNTNSIQNPNQNQNYLTSLKKQSDQIQQGDTNDHNVFNYTNKKKFSQSANNPGHQIKYSDRLVESINTVRQLLKSNKQLRQQLDISSQQNNEKDVQIYELTKQNQFLKDKIPNKYQYLANYQTIPASTEYKSKNNSISKLNKMFNNTTTIMDRYIPDPQPPNMRNTFSYRNSIQINQFYNNQKGIDSIPTNFNRMNINSRKNNRLQNKTNNTIDNNKDCHMIAAKSNKSNWMTKNMEGTKFLSFYHDPSKQEQHKYY